MKEEKTKSFDFASETTKLIISLSTGVITVILTFSDKILKDVEIKWILITSIIFLLFSILSGLMVMMALTGSLASYKNIKPNISTSNIKIPSVVQLFSFVISMTLFSIHIILLI
ncbi:hypothetical protein [uncultured Winogradskyella sp.]|uniref:hypothetical protein n=1 Tax=uncultured Winogradskyella sp. TaxID=395353 RepID=UPI00260219A2|nr:hypothetical protein [uncultured Winogradskyella sp.]